VQRNAVKRKSQPRSGGGGEVIDKQGTGWIPQVSGGSHRLLDEDRWKYSA